VVLRSGFDSAATWVWFDVGPYGSSGHAHRDKLSLMVHARGSMLLVDSGRFAYEGTDTSGLLHRQYAPNTTAHNTLTLDGCEQEALPALARAPVPASSVVLSPHADTAVGNMSLWTGLVGAATHTRAVYYQRPVAGAGAEAGAADGDGDWLAVVDVVDAGASPRRVQATWHTHPNATGLMLDPESRAASVGGVNGSTGLPTDAQICVIPALSGAMQWAAASVVRGRVQNATQTWQGWYSESYDDAWPSSTLIYDADVPAGGSSVFAWLLIPTSTRAPCSTSSIAVLSATAAAARVRVVVAGAAPVDVTVPLA